IPAKSSKRPNLFPRFPGFGDGMRLPADFLIDSQLHRSIPERRFEDLCRGARTDEKVIAIADLFLDEIEYLSQKTSADVFICAFPFVLVKFLDQDDDEVILAEQEEEDVQGDEIIQVVPSKLIL